MAFGLAREIFVEWDMYIQLVSTCLTENKIDQQLLVID